MCVGSSASTACASTSSYPTPSRPTNTPFFPYTTLFRSKCASFLCKAMLCYIFLCLCFGTESDSNVLTLCINNLPVFLSCGWIYLLLLNCFPCLMACGIYFFPVFMNWYATGSQFCSDLCL